MPLYIHGTLYLHVILIHSSEAIDMLRRITATKTSPGLSFTGVFTNNHIVEETECNVWLFSMLNNSSKEYCDFSHHRLRQQWYCEKPSTLRCDAVPKFKITRFNDACVILKQSQLFEK